MDKGFLKMLLKMMMIVFIISMMIKPASEKGVTPYQSIKEYSYQNDFIPEQSETIQGKEVTQHFISKGNVLTNISLYFTDTRSELLNISIRDKDGRVIKSVAVRPDDHVTGSWDQIAVDCKGMRRGDEYLIHIQSDQGLGSLLLDEGDRPDVYLDCETEEGIVDKGLVAGIHQTYHYLTFASAMELAFDLLILFLLLLALCYSVLHLETFLSVLRRSEHKCGLLYSLYFACSLTLSVDPIDPVLTDVKDFGRVFGAAFIANVDVSRRIDNFYLWFIYFAFVSCLFYLLVNHCKQGGFPGERKKVADFLDDVMVLAGIDLLFRCITYFADQSSMQTVFYYSSAVIRLIIVLCVAYLVLRLDKKVSAGLFLQLEMIAFCVAFPVAVISHQEWQSGKLLFGMQAVLMLLVIPAVCSSSRFVNTKKGQALIKAGVLMSAMIPFFTSFYIESVNILNQYGIFVTHLRRYYGIAVMAGGMLTGILAVLVYRKDRPFSKIKPWLYFWLVFGITCLNVQVPLQKIYNADVFETANTSILISDLLNHGDIPVVQHYGGHMMSGVWEGIIYAVVNKDFSGAVFSPYSGYLMTVLASLFFLMLRKIWADDIAFLVTVLFPFYNSWSTFGLGMLVCLAVWAYIKKNTYPRAGTVWLAFIWCALYRLDIGFSFGLACIAAMAVYILCDRNRRAAKQLLTTLAVWLVIGGVLWTGLCLLKGIDPVSRLWEFIQISLSNQNWAFEDIGNKNITLFAWCYLFLPFCVAGCLAYAALSKNFRRSAGDKIWILILILGFAYFANTPRGLVRHSLAETKVWTVTWDAYLFLAVFAVAATRKKRMFLPVMTALILCGSALTSTGNHSGSPIAAGAAARLGTFTEKWLPDRFAREDGNGDVPLTYWQELARDGEPAERVEWDPALKNRVEPYRSVLDTLLDQGETFVDFMNRTFMYSAINRQDPVYVSQSPLQLSGEFTQERFISQIEGIPVVLMPLDNNREASSLDGIPNAYRYYKVAEYIYQNYVPLCRYGTEFAVWCLPERQEGYERRLSGLVEGQDYKEMIGSDDKIVLRNCERDICGTDGDVMLTYTGADPGLEELQRVLDLSPYFGKTVRITVRYSTDTDGTLQLFYTSENGERYTESKSVTARIAGEGTAEFVIPVTEHTRLRLDIPEKSIVSIRSFTAGYPVSYIDHGYDGPAVSVDADGKRLYSYGNGFHNYSLKYLPNIWAEHDDAVYDTPYCGLTEKDGIYVFDRGKITSDEMGNYLHIRAVYDGVDAGRSYEPDDETVDATVKVGVYKDGEFTERYQYGFTVREGVGDYLIRVSSDYYWYLEEVNAVAVSGSGVLRDVQMEILEGD